MTDDSSLAKFVVKVPGGRKETHLYILCFLNCLLCILFNEIIFVQGYHGGGKYLRQW